MIPLDVEALARTVADRTATTEQLHHIIGVVARTVWDQKVPAGEHLWTIPADPKRDFDCLLSAAVDELAQWREAAPQLLDAARRLARLEALVRPSADDADLSMEYRAAMRHVLALLSASEGKANG